MKKKRNPNEPFQMSVDVRSIATAEKVEKWLAENGYCNIQRNEFIDIGFGGYDSAGFSIKFDCPGLTYGEMAALGNQEYFERRAKIISAIKEGIR